MLVLSRKRHEEIIIGTGSEKIVLKILDIDRSRIKIGITAPKETNVRRAELPEIIMDGDGGDGHKQD